MSKSEAVLLQRFCTNGDTDAFSEIVRRYAGMVYGVCIRILRDEADAADVTQETFFQMLRNADKISGSPGAWLHRVATHKSIDSIRRGTSRRRREQDYAAGSPYPVSHWQDIAEDVDKALDELDESNRSLLMEHFLAGKTMTQIAQERGISQATVSRQTTAALEQLRVRLGRKGLLATSAVLSTLLMENASQAAPAHVAMGLSKIAMVGASGLAAGHGGSAAVAAKVGVGGVFAGVQGWLIAAAVVGVVSVAGYVHYSGPSHPQQTPARPQTWETVQPTGPQTGRKQPRATGGQTVDDPDPTRYGGMATVVQGQVDGPQPQRMGGMGFGGGMMMGGMRGPGPAQAGTSDFTTPEGTISSLMALLEQGNVDQIGTCLAEGVDQAGLTQTPVGQCLQYLGGPIEVQEYIEDDTGVQIRWQCLVREGFPLDDETWSAGDTFGLSARLVDADGQWKIAGLELGSQQ